MNSATSRRAGLEFVCILGHDGFASNRAGDGSIDARLVTLQPYVYLSRVTDSSMRG